MVIHDPELCRQEHAAFRRRAPGATVRALSPPSGKRLRILEAAVSLLDLRALPSNRLGALKGDRKAQYGIRINDQWRICFEWRADTDGPENIEIIDDH